jgi:hypothetical protein
MMTRDAGQQQRTSQQQRKVVLLDRLAERAAIDQVLEAA